MAYALLKVIINLYFFNYISLQDSECPAKGNIQHHPLAHHVTIDPDSNSGKSTVQSSPNVISSGVRTVRSRDHNKGLPTGPRCSPARSRDASNSSVSSNRSYGYGNMGPRPVTANYGGSGGGYSHQPHHHLPPHSLSTSAEHYTASREIRHSTSYCAGGNGHPKPFHSQPHPLGGRAASKVFRPTGKKKRSGSGGRGGNAGGVNSLGNGHQPNHHQQQHHRRENTNNNVLNR